MTEEQKPKVYKSIQEGLLDVAKYGAEIYKQKIKMTDEQILSLVEQYFVELNPFSGITPKEYGGRPDAFLKFARVVYDKGRDDEAELYVDENY